MVDGEQDKRDGFGLELAALLFVWSILPFNGGLNELVWGEQSIDPNFWAQEFGRSLTFVADLLVLFAFSYRAGLRGPALGFSRPSALQCFWAVPLWAVMAVLMRTGFEFTETFPDFAGWVMQPSDWPARTTLQKRFELCLFVPLAAFAEEVFYRGYLVGRLQQRGWRESKIVWLSALAFGVPHYDGGPIKVFATVLLGAAFAWGYLRVKNLWPFIAGHVAHNVSLYAW